MIIARGKAAATPVFLVEEVDDPAEVARSRAQHERFQRNSQWLQAHWGDLLPRACGKFLAVAGQEGFVTDTPEEAWAWVDRAHPGDDGAFVQYVRPTEGPQIYACQR